MHILQSLMLLFDPLTMMINLLKSIILIIGTATNLWDSAPLLKKSGSVPELKKMYHKFYLKKIDGYITKIYRSITKVGQDT